ncbi:hypothetical protein E2C01_035265 [Portunus trituberculatus]|uniref:Uncharacterized protein n=1 Tax=Portunus trituberculatus TaxID=210409 RepID=A0A5B7FB07_PORTR|nr:hypothetical protein [Portunus trituberculatus]
MAALPQYTLGRRHPAWWLQRRWRHDKVRDLPCSRLPPAPPRPSPPLLQATLPLPALASTPHPFPAHSCTNSSSTSPAPRSELTE